MKDSQKQSDHSWIYVILFIFVCGKIGQCENKEAAKKIMEDPKLKKEWNVNSVKEAEEAVEEAKSYNY